MPLFINEESGGKQRLIANAKGGGHNAWTSDEETLFVIAVGFAADAALMITEESASDSTSPRTPSTGRQRNFSRRCRTGPSAA